MLKKGVFAKRWHLQINCHGQDWTKGRIRGLIKNNSTALPALISLGDPESKGDLLIDQCTIAPLKCPSTGASAGRWEDLTRTERAEKIG